MKFRHLHIVHRMLHGCNLYHKTTGGTNHKLRSGRLHIKESGSDFNEFEIPSFLPSE